MIEIATIASAVAGIENIANKTNDRKLSETKINCSTAKAINSDKCFAAMVMTTIVSVATIACISIKK